MSERAVACGTQADSAAAHLRSTQAVNGYHVKATDGLAGYVCDFLIDEKNWALRQLVVKTGHRFSGKEVEISTGDVLRISYEDSTVSVNLTVAEIEKRPLHSPAPVLAAA
jgi:hypothetical protein